MKRIAIFPAAGALGSSIISHLLRLVPAESLILVCRYPDKVPRAHVDAGVTVRHGAWESTPEHLAAAFAGADCLLLISYPSHEHGPRVKVHIPAIDAALAAGARHLVYTSLAMAGPATGKTSRAHVMQAHLDTEAHLERAAAADPAVTYTNVRAGLYAESFPMYTSFFSPAAPVDEVLVPHDGAPPGVAWAKRDELGEATARILGLWAAAPAAAAFPYRNETVLLTGPQVLSLGETVGVLGGVVGRSPRIREVSKGEFAKLPHVRQSLALIGDSDEMVLTWATSFDAIRDGECAVVSPALGEILGRAPQTFEDTIRGGWDFHHFK